MPLSPDEQLDFVPTGTWRPIRPLTMALLLEAFRQGVDLDLACELVGDVVDEMATEAGTPRTLLKAVNLLTFRIEERKPF